MTQTNNTFVADFNNTYNATSNLNPMDYPASIISLCDYILSNDKENIDWNAAGNMFRCFNNEDNTFLFHSFKNAAQSVTFFVKVMEVGFNEVMDGAYSALIHRVETLKESCKELLMETAKAIAKDMGFDFNGAVGEYLVSAENDCTYTVNVEFTKMGIEIIEFYDGLRCSFIPTQYEDFDESDFVYDLKEAIGNVAVSALNDMVSYLNDDCDECIEDTFETNNDEIGIDFRGREKSDAVLVHYDREIKSIVIRDYSGEEKLTDFCYFVEEFTEFCRERLGEEYTENWTYTAA